MSPVFSSSLFVLIVSFSFGVGILGVGRVRMFHSELHQYVLDIQRLINRHSVVYVDYVDSNTCLSLAQVLHLEVSPQLKFLQGCSALPCFAKKLGSRRRRSPQ